jgi:succinate dehydrogenase hydrophobic anchor subunit
MRRFATLSALVAVFLMVWVVPAMAQTTEPADYSTPVGDFVGDAAAAAWPIALVLVTAFLGITLGIAGLRAGLRRIKSLVR